jgi:hypothetical protein
LSTAFSIACAIMASWVEEPLGLADAVRYTVRVTDAPTA